MRPAWAHGRNYDADRLEIYTNESGFILGLSNLGDKLGVDGADVLMPGTFTSISFGVSSSVESGLFVHRDVAVCTLSATMPSYLSLKGKRLSIKYDGALLFKGTVQEVEWTEEMDDRYWLPGNTERKSYSVSLTVSAGDEQFSDAEAPTPGAVGGQVYGRVASWLDLDYEATYSDPADDLGEELYFNVRDWLNLATTIEAASSLQDALRDALKIWNMHYIYKPWDSTVEIRNNNRWHLGTNEGDTLFFSDNPGDDDQTAGSDEYVHEDRFVMYSIREYGYEADYFQGSAKVAITNLSNVETVYGPYRASEVRPSDTVIDLGKTDTDDYDALARNYASTLPLKRSSEPFTKAISMPLQSIKQLEDTQVPGMALLKHENTTERVAVLGVSHSITPNLWTVTYTLGPHHLLDRESDFDPSLPINGSLAVVGSVVNVQWHTPRSLPTDVPLWRYVFLETDPFRNSISWTSSGMTVIQKTKVSGEVTGDTQTASFTKPVGSGNYDYFVAYTSDPNPGSGVVNHQYRQSQPLFLGTVVIP